MPPCHAAKLQKKTANRLFSFYLLLLKREFSACRRTPRREQSVGNALFFFYFPRFSRFSRGLFIEARGLLSFSGAGNLLLGKNRQKAPRRAPVVRGTKKTPRPVRRDTAWLIQTRVQRFMLLRELP